MLKKPTEKSVQLPNHKYIDIFRERLLSWYAQNGRTFPWRKKSISKYKLVVSEVLLQRTRAETVAQFFNSFMTKYPSWLALSQAKDPELIEMIRPIGLWKRRSVSLKQLAAQMVMRNGRFPAARAEIEDIPGVGQYIANAIMILCHGEPQPLLDGNMARVLERVFGPRKLADIRYDPYLQSLAKEVVRCNNSKELNWAILDLAASTCRIKKPSCGCCPARNICTYARGEGS